MAAADGPSDSVPLLAFRNLTKRFGAGGGTKALDDVSLTIWPGEVHGLLGENGSGKSTLIKTLAGFHEPDAGKLEFAGNPVSLPIQAGQFRKLAISFVHQDLALVPSLSVVENLYIHDIVTAHNRWHISWRSEEARARATFKKYGIGLDPGAPVGSLRPVERALLAIVRAVEGMQSGDLEGPGLLVLDEPTVFLPKHDVDQLFRLVREIAASGSSVLFVSHDLDEVREITDHVTVLRNGQNVGTNVTADLTKDDLIRLIVGHELHRDAMSVRELPVVKSTGTPAVEVDGLSGGLLKDVTFSLRRGEVLGVTGLAGSGFEEVPYLLFGAKAATSGTLILDDVKVNLPDLTPAAALAAGIALVPGNRQEEGSIGSVSVADNVTMQVLKRYLRLGRLQRKRMIVDAEVLGARYDVRPNNPSLTFSSLSGGNQQKALLAKWFSTEPPIVLLHEPTQGVDIGAREQIFSIIREAADAGASVLCASSDYEQLAIVCSRVMVFSAGTLVRELSGSGVTKEHIAELVISASG